MNKFQAIKILIDNATAEPVKTACQNPDEVQAAVLIMEHYLKENKKDIQVDIKGLEFKLMKGI